MAVTEQQLARRDKEGLIGASELCSFMGLNPYETAYDWWLRRTGRVPPFEGNDATRLGQQLEPLIVENATKELGEIVTDPEALEFRLKGTPLCVHPDGIVVAEGVGLEAKTAGAFGPLSPEWGEPFTDEVPAPYIVQVHAHMACMPGSPEYEWINAHLGGRGFCLYRVERNNALCDAVIEASIKAGRCLKTDTPPPESIPSLDVIRKAHRLPGRVAKVSPILYQQMQNAKEAAAEAQKRSEEYEAQLLAADPEADAFDFGDEEKILTFYESERKGYTVKPTKVRRLLSVKRPKELPILKDEVQDGE